ncbi:uncharacterized protein FMAN_05771 [Fusarium mangiferae]|uniref:Uncharacterized protein n=1 Tax=Fusarium mangiferae TaxID=192010 RepID=A0A1L7SVI7_FUSMA|nr:uncharacterized protein FMAN_05771 [Fusarium mangiferae]CVK87052.1 uncharacterized protein FMAN_05771 [Fusarium mangiferae]
MASQGRDRLILREDIINDDRVASSRHPNTILRNHRMLRKEEKLALIQHAQEYARVLVHQRGQTTANSEKPLKKFYAEIFLHWSTSQKRNPNPSSTYPEDLQTLVGSIKKTCSKEAGNAITQKVDLEQQYGRSIVPGRIEFEPGLTVTQAKINAIHNYDNHERRRISSSNTQHIICATRRILVKWAARGSESPLKIEPGDMVSRIQPLVLASDLARSMAATYSQIVEGMNGENEGGTDDPDSD